MRLGKGIAERLMSFTVTVVKMTSQLPRDVAGRHVASQLIRSATGAGANYEEARAAESREDFVHKVAIAAKEARETIYWLEFIRRSGWTTVDTQEARELAAILGASARTARHNAQKI